MNSIWKGYRDPDREMIKGRRGAAFLAWLLAIFEVYKKCAYKLGAECSKYLLQR